MAASAAAGNALHVGTLGLVMEPVGTTIERLVREADTRPAGDARSQLPAVRDPGSGRVPRPDRPHRQPRGRGQGQRRRPALPGTGRRARVDDRAPARRSACGWSCAPMAADDVEIRTRTARASVAVPTVDVVDTVGAGDVFGGGFLASWVGAGRGRDELDDHGSGAANPCGWPYGAAALSCTRPGADPPTVAELEAFPG